MELMNWLLLAALFIAGLIFNPATGKFYAWLFDVTRRFFRNEPSVTSPAAATATTAALKRDESRDVKKREEVRSVFVSFDRNGDGFLTKEEIQESLHNLGISMAEKDIKEVVEKLDANRDGLVDIDEFCELFESLTAQEEEGGREAELKEAFDVFDSDGDGLISVEELGRVLESFGLQEGRKMENCKEMIRKVDADGDGMVSFDEFKRMMRGGGMLVSAF